MTFHDRSPLMSPAPRRNRRGVPFSAMAPFLAVLAFAFLHSSAVRAADGPFQRVEVPSSFHPVGSGARALGMGGAFIAVADDATAASWNPGGLVQVERPELSVVGAASWRTEDNSLALSDDAGDEHVTDVRLNYLSAALPFRLWERNWVVSLNWQHLYDFDREWSFGLSQSSSSTDASTGTGADIRQDVTLSQDGDLGAWGVALSGQLTPTLSVGITLNFWENGPYRNRWERFSRQTGEGTAADNPLTFEATSLDRYDLSGLNANLGLLWRITPEWTLGMVFKTPFAADVAHRGQGSESVRYPGQTGGYERTWEERTDETLAMPLGIGVGVAWRPAPHLSFSADVYRTEWDDAELEMEDGRRLSPITGQEDAGEVHPTHQIRLGAEYLSAGPIA